MDQTFPRNKSVLLVLVSLILLIPLLVLFPKPATSASQGEVTIGYFSPLTTDQLDPAQYKLVGYYCIVSTIHDALVKAMPGELYGKNLAESWTTTRNGLTYEFKLRRGVKFHNGDTVTATDVRFSFLRYSGQGASIFKSKVREVEIVDDHTVRFHLSSPWPDFLTYLGSMATAAGYVVPKKYLEQVGEAGFLRRPIGAGPYKFVEFRPGERLVLEAFEGYWRKVPSVKRIVIKEIREPTARAAALKAGETDSAMTFSGSLFENLEKDRRLKTFATLPGSSAFLALFDQWDPKSPLRDYRVRKAVSLAIDRKEMNKAIWLGHGRETGNFIPPDMEYALPAKPDPYDPARARNLIKEAGFQPGSIMLEVNPYPVTTKTGEMVAAYLDAIGIKTKIVSLEKAAFDRKWKTLELKGIGAWHTLVPGNAATLMELFVVPGGSYSVLPKGAVPELEELNAKQSLEINVEKRRDILHKMQQIIMDKMLVVPMLEFPVLNAAGPRLAEPAINLIPRMPYIGPYDDIRLK